MAIKEFKSGKWYIYTGPYNPTGENWNTDSGYMDFIMDRKPHQCNKGYKQRASFFDSKNAANDWFWHKQDMEHFHELNSPEIDWQEVFEAKK